MPIPWQFSIYRVETERCQFNKNYSSPVADIISTPNSATNFVPDLSRGMPSCISRRHLPKLADPDL